MVLNSHSLFGILQMDHHGSFCFQSVCLEDVFSYEPFVLTDVWLIQQTNTAILCLWLAAIFASAQDKCTKILCEI